MVYWSYVVVRVCICIYKLPYSRLNRHSRLELSVNGFGTLYGRSGWLMAMVCCGVQIVVYPLSCINAYSLIEHVIGNQVMLLIWHSTSGVCSPVIYFAWRHSATQVINVAVLNNAKYVTTVAIVHSRQHILVFCYIVLILHSGNHI